MVIFLMSNSLTWTFRSEFVLEATTSLDLGMLGEFKLAFKAAKKRQKC